jgi:hypothetical protein
MIKNFRQNLISTLNNFMLRYNLIIILAGILIISFLSSNKIYLLIFKDVINSIILLSFFLILDLTVNSKKQMAYFVQIFLALILWFALIIAIYRLIMLFSLDMDKSKYMNVQIIQNARQYLSIIDDNFAILPVFFGIGIIISFLINKISLLKRIEYNLFLVIFSISIIFAGSRRGIIVLLGIICFLLVAQIFSFFKKEGILRQIALGTRYFLLTFLFLAASVCFFIFNGSFKNRALYLVGSNKLLSTKLEIAMKISRYYSAVDYTKTYSDLYKILWAPVFDPTDPISGWGSRIHKTISPLTGDNVEIVPIGTKGYLMDHTCNADTSDGYAYSTTWISNYVVDESKVLEASVFCYVSNDCNLSMANICSLGAMGNPGAIYDLKNKGTWQKLSFKVNCRKGNAGVLLYFSKSGVNDFSSLKGYVIFAYPESRLTDKSDSTLSNSFYFNIFNQNSTLRSKIILSKDNISNLFHDRFRLRNENLFISNSKLNRGQGLYSKDLLNSQSLTKNKYYKAGVFELNKSMFPLFMMPVDDNDPIRRWVSRFISEDTTYHNFTNNLVANTVTGNFISGRTSRWKFALKIFLKEFNLKQKIFGGGFNFLNWYGFYFLKDKALDDYPHNPFLSILLYSGIFGLSLYFFLLYKVFVYYLKYIKEYYLFYVFFLLTFFFSFFSADSPFDPPIMGFFILLPFFIHSFHKNDNQPIIEKLTNDEDTDHRD